MEVCDPIKCVPNGDAPCANGDESQSNEPSHLPQSPSDRILKDGFPIDRAPATEDVQSELLAGGLHSNHGVVTDGVTIEDQTASDSFTGRSGHVSTNGGLESRMPAASESTTDGWASSQLSVGLTHGEVLPIAVIGMACRLPGGSSNPEKLWDLLANGKSAWSKIPPERFNQSSFEHPSSSVGGTFNSKGAHFLEEDVSLLDAPAFNISPLEARAMDPQMRLQLEVTYEALENGITLGKIAGSKTAVFIGVFSDDYSNMMLSDPESLPPHHVTGTGKAIFANRISYYFDLKGPSLALDTGCSASLVALHQACQSIMSGESEQAIVGGVNLMLYPKTAISLDGLGFLSDEGRCYSFDSRGSGYGRGEGVATVVLKPLKDAIASGDPIRAVIRNTVVNQDGRTTGLTMPNCEAQISMMRDAYAHAGLDPAGTQYVEAHGMGSVKANIGHLESASGIAGLVKAILCLEKGLIPPSINFESENPELSLSDRNMKVARKLLPWPSNGLRRASLNSFGYGGTNAHVILDAYQGHGAASHAGHRRSSQHTKSTSNCDVVKNSQQHESIRHKKLFLVTHRTKAGTERLAEDLLTYIKANIETVDCNLLHHLAYTIGSRRTKFKWRCAVTASTLQELAAALNSESLEVRKAPQDVRVAYIFTGQGAQWYAMGRELIGQYEVFKTTLRAADSHIQSLGGSWSVMDELLKDSASSRVHSAAIGQPLCTAIQCALVDLLTSWHIAPKSVVGHSSGEIAAGYACGSLTLRSAMTISYRRGLLASTKLEQMRGGMLAAGVSETEAEIFINRIPPGKGKAVIACVNGPRSVTLSGDRSAIMSLQSMLEARQLFARKLGVSTAYHSPHMDMVAHSYLAALQDLPVSSPNNQVRFFSSVTGDLMDGELLDGAYWVKNMVSQVKFSQALQQLYQASNTYTGEASSLGTQASQLMVEIGPHSALAGPVKQSLSILKDSKFKYVASLVRGQDAVDTVLNAAKSLAVAGVDVDLEAVNAQDIGQPLRVLSDLPPYPWDHSSSFWHESRLSLDYRKRSAARHPLLGAPTPDFNRIEPTWRNIIKLSEIPWLRGHVVQSNVVYPAAGYIAMAIEAALQRHRLSRPTEIIAQYKLKQVSIGKPLLIPDGAEGVETQFVLRPYNPSARKPSALWDEFRVFSFSTDDGWSEHCRGLISIHHGHDNMEVERNRKMELGVESHAKRMAEISVLCQSSTDPDELYETLGQVGMHFQNAFRCIESARASTQQSFGHIRIPNTAEMMPAGVEHPHVLHPATLDACMQMTTPILFKAGALQLPMVPTYVEEIVVSNDVPRQAGKRLLVHSELQLSTKRSLKAHITANRDATGEPELPLIEVKGLQCTAIPGGFSSGDQAIGASGKCHRLQWIPFELDKTDKTIVPNHIARTEGVKETLHPVLLVQPTAVSPASDRVTSNLSSMLSQRLVRTYSSLEDILDPIPEGSICICLAELHGPILKQLTQPQWIALRKMLSSASNVLWVTQGGAMAVSTPEAGLVSGLARSAMSDNPALRLITLDTDPSQVSSEDTARSIISILDRAFPSSESQEPLVDREYVERAGQVFVPRVVEDDSLQQHLTADTMSPECEAQPFLQSMRPLRLEVETPGLLDSLRFVEDTAARAPLAANELRMQPKCYGVNFRDVMIALGQLEASSLMSSEHSGIVIEVGKDMAYSFQVGDRICAWGGSAYASSVTVDGLAAQRIPDAMSFEEAASVPIVYATVYYGLLHLARLRKGETVLIHSAAGGVGQAAIMLAKYLQAEIFVTVGSSEKKALVMTKYGIPEDHIFSSRHLCFGNGVMRLTSGKGVDVVLNSIAGEAFHETFNCLGKLGRFIEIGKRDILEDTRLNMGTFNRSVTFASVDLSIVFQHDPGLAKRMITEVFTLLKQGSLQPVHPLNIFPLSDIERAFRLMQAGMHTGKVVLKADNDTVVKALPSSTASALFDENASYMIIGGLGGLGLAICRWMADRGCRNIIALSRSGMKSASAKDLKNDLDRAGVKLAVYACDVGDSHSVTQVVASCAQEMPPIKGLINAGMVIRDTTINNMTLTDYNAALSPNVQGTWNLHHALSHLPNTLDFFLLLSSCVGIVGNNGQSNYASGCTFQDAFARFRTPLGHPTRSLDLGMMEGAGYIHANPEIRRFAIAQGFQPVTLPELFAAIEYAITRPIRDDDDCQLMLGLTGGGKTAVGGASPINFADPKFELLRRQDTAANPGQSSQSSLSALLAAASSKQQAHHIIANALVAQVSKVLVVPVEDINPTMPISHYGGDSLAAVEIRNWVARNLNASVGVMEILSGRSLDALAWEIGGRSSYMKENKE